VRAHIRYAGTDTVLAVEATFPAHDDIGRLRREFEILHKRRCGFVAENKALVIDAVEVETVGGGAGQAEGAVDATATGEPDAVRHNR
ncbi:hypothetical protein GY999_27705, partial [Klebsiella variicola]|uniref:hypothetical protein n=1 Tax=Klebsiella variicola TaxID=244366 RepID=UPI0015C43CFA